MNRMDGVKNEIKQKNKRRKSTGRQAVFLAAVLLLVSICFPVPAVYTDAASPAVTLNYSTYTLLKGKKLKLKAVISDENLASEKVIWASSSTDFVTVNQSGMIKAKKAGSAQITATIQGTNQSASCTVKVVNKPKKEKNASDVKTLTKIIQSFPSDVSVSTDTDNANEYTWTDMGKESRLTGIRWRGLG